MRDHYVHGDYNVICDASGFKRKRSECRRQWNGLLVSNEFWEPRHPQDFVRGKIDDQSVPDPRPESVDVESQKTTTLSADEAAGQTTLSVASTTHMRAGRTVIVFLDSDQTHVSTVSSFTSSEVTILNGLPHKASIGNQVVVVVNEITADDL